MKLGYIGLGKMGYHMVERLLEKGYSCVVTNDKNRETIKKAEAAGAEGVYSVEEVVSKLKSPRVVWIMVPYKVVDNVLERLVPHLEEGDTVIDGGNSPYQESVRRAEELRAKGIHFLDVGVSGGPSGARNGACLMVGGEKEQYEKFEKLFKDLSVEDGYGYMGKSGAGHFVKMVHNGIEYGMMQAIAEGFEVMKKSDFDLNMEDIADVYNHGSVIESRLVGWLKRAYAEHGEDLKDISGEVSHSGEGEWTVEAAKKLGVTVPIIEGAFQFRVHSKGNPSYTGKVLSALRNQFGGHDVTNR